MAEAEAAQWQAWFEELQERVEDPEEDVNADEELHSLNTWLHEYPSQTILFGRDRPCVHVFTDGSVFCCCHLKQVPPEQALRLADLLEQCVVGQSDRIQ